MEERDDPRSLFDSRLNCIILKDEFIEEDYFESRDFNSILISKSVKEIEDDAFYGCDKLLNVYYDGSIEDWCNIIFYNEKSNPMSCGSHFYLKEDNDWVELKHLIIPDTVNIIDGYQFYGFDNLLSVTIPKNVEEIGCYAFYNCYRLVEVFNFSSLNIYKGDSSNGYVGYYAKNVDNLCNKSQMIKTENGLMFIKDDNEYYLVGYDGVNSFLTLPNSMNGFKYKINNYAFYNCHNLKRIVIGRGVKSIGYNAFDKCIKLKEVYNLSKFKVLRRSRDNGCLGYYARIIYKSLNDSKYVSRGEYSFIYKNKTYYLVDYNGLSSELVLPRYINGSGYEIDDYAFAYGNIKNITIPNTVKSIAPTAFFGCFDINVHYEE